MIKKNKKIILLIFVILILILMVYKLKVLSALNDLGLLSAPCIDDVCIQVSNDWLVLYNDQSLLSDVIVVFSDYDKKSLCFINKDSNKTAHVFKNERINYKFIADDKMNSTIKYDWGDIVVLHNDNFSDDNGYRFVIEKNNLFVSSTSNLFSNAILGVNKK